MPGQDRKPQHGGHGRNAPHGNRQAAPPDEFPFETLPLPSWGRRAFRAHKGQSSQNPGLVFSRFMPDWSNRNSGPKPVGLKAVLEAGQQMDRALFDAWVRRWERTVAGAHAIEMKLATDWRLLPGLGRHSAMEVGFHFNLYGFPYVPGASVKGLARARARVYIAEKLGKGISLSQMDEILSIEKDHKFDHAVRDWPVDPKGYGNAFRTIFGTQSAAGKAVFFDAIPASAAKPLMEMDIMNPHYPDYYSGVEPPADWQQPVPIAFLAVPAGTPFRFSVGWRIDPDDDAKKLQALALAWLKQGLTWMGIGAKTTSGYGYFNEIKKGCSA